MNKKVLIYAYTKYNLGDDLLIQILCNRYPNVQFLLYTYPEYQAVFENCLNLKVMSNSNIVSKVINAVGRLLKNRNAYENIIAKQCDASVCITGSLFIQGEEDWQPYLTYMKSRQIPEIPYYQLGSNFGPYKDREFYEGFKEFFANCEDVCFREKFSYDLFADLTNVRVAPDVVFLGEFPMRKAEKRVSISVINLNNRRELEKYQTQYRDFIVDVCRYYCKKGYQVNLMSFCKEEGDENMIDEVLNRLETEEERQAVIPVLYRGDINGIISLISRSEVVVATRFHAMILGWCMKKKVLPIIYSPKMEHVIEEINYGGPVVHIGDKEDVEEILKNLERYDIFDVSDICMEAEKHFYKLDKCLK